MPLQGKGGRSYDSDEVAAILQAAVALDQPQSASPRLPGRGMTLAQIQQIAAELGISPAAVRTASLQVSSDQVPARCLVEDLFSRALARVGAIAEFQGPE